MASPANNLDPQPQTKLEPWIPHVLPFIVWMFVAHMAGEPGGINYAARTGFGFLALAVLRPWRWYRPPQWKHLVSGAIVGLFVYAFWVLPESRWASKFEGWHRFYMTVGTLPPWKLWPPAERIVYAPDAIGWPLVCVRLFGSAVVIAVIEEFFWRGWMLRWIARQDFLNERFEKWNWSALLVSALMFATVHNRWFVAFLCGLCYGALYMRTKSIWPPVVAHIVTNLVLGLYVIGTDNYAFWSQ